MHTLHLDSGNSGAVYPPFKEPIERSFALIAQIGWQVLLEGMLEIERRKRAADIVTLNTPQHIEKM